jgi:hypothetical protein
MSRSHESRVWKVFLLAVSLSLALPCLAQAAEDTKPDLPRNDTQIWYEGWLTVPVSESVDITGIGSARLGRGLDHWVFERAYVSASWRLSKLLSIGSYYSYCAVQGLPDMDAREHRFGFDGSVGWHIHAFQMSDRSRIETRVLPTYTYSRYRNRLLVQHPLAVRGRQVTLYASEEVYYDGQLSAWSRSRFTAGFNKRMSSRISVDFYYLRQNDHYTKPGDIHAIGITFKAQTRRL